MFIGRQEELRKLTQLKEKKAASLVVIKGRRRIGKSSLVDEFSKQFSSFIKFEGLAPSANSSSTQQLKHFAKQFSNNFRLPDVTFTDWAEAFSHLAEQTARGQHLILLDEVSWLGSKHPDFAGQLKIAWDNALKKNARLILILCGSVSSWIERQEG